MKKIVFFSLLPILLLAKFQVTTYFPLETYMAEYIGKSQIRVKQINNRYLSEKREISNFNLSKLADVKTYIHLGLDVEKEYIKTFKEYNPFIRVLDLSKGVKIIKDNPYYWMDPFNLRAVAKNIYNEFCEIDKLNCNFYKINYEAFLDEIDRTFLLIKNKIYSSPVQNIYVFDDYWDYFAKRYRLKLFKIKKEIINLNQINNLLKLTKERNITKLIYLKGDSYNIANSIARNANISLLEATPYDENIFLNLKKIAQELIK